jgi:rare lipoprotein A
VGTDERDLHRGWRAALAGWAGLVLTAALAGCAGRRVPEVAAVGWIQEGIASYYDGEFVGRPTASGEILSPELLTAAHPTLPFGSLLKVTNLANGREALVTVNDRGPFVKNRILDLTLAGAKALDYVGAGTTPVRLVVLALPAPAAPLWLQVGAFQDRARAEALAAELRGRGESPGLVEEAGWTKVRLGPYRDEPQAVAARRRCRALGLDGYFLRRP